MPEIPVVVLGAAAVGKSAIVVQYIQGHFVERYDSTIEDIYRKPCKVDGKDAVLSVVDTAGQDSFASLREQYYKSGEVFLLVFSVTDAQSLQKLKGMYEKLSQVRKAMSSGNTPCVVVANKVDLGASEKRAVSPEEGKEFARFANNSRYFEITARDKTQVDEIFDHVVRLSRGEATFPVESSGGGARAGSSTITDRSNTTFVEAVLAALAED